MSAVQHLPFGPHSQNTSIRLQGLISFQEGLSPGGIEFQFVIEGFIGTCHGRIHKYQHLMKDIHIVYFLLGLLPFLFTAAVFILIQKEFSQQCFLQERIKPYQGLPDPSNLLSFVFYRVNLSGNDILYESLPSGGTLLQDCLNLLLYPGFSFFLLFTVALQTSSDNRRFLFHQCFMNNLLSVSYIL